MHMEGVFISREVSAKGYEVGQKHNIKTMAGSILESLENKELIQLHNSMINQKICR